MAVQACKMFYLGEWGAGNFDEKKSSKLLLDRNANNQGI